MKPRVANKLDRSARSGIARLLLASGAAMLMMAFGVRQSSAQGNGNPSVPSLQVAAFQLLPQADSNAVLSESLNSRPYFWVTDGVDHTSYTLHTKPASVFISCLPGGENFKLVTLVTASTNPLAAAWYLEDIKIRTQQAAEKKPTTGNPVPQIIDGSFASIQVDRFPLADTFTGVMSNASSALSRLGFRVTSRSGTTYSASNASAAIVLSVSTTADPNRQEVAVVGTSSDPAITRAACDSVKHAMQTSVRID
jgi:hypothetical protein